MFNNLGLEKKCNYDPGYFANTVIFLLGTIIGPILFVPAGLYLLVSAAMDPYDEKEDGFPMFAKA